VLIPPPAIVTAFVNPLTDVTVFPLVTQVEQEIVPLTESSTKGEVAATAIVPFASGTYSVLVLPEVMLERLN